MRTLNIRATVVATALAALVIGASGTAAADDPAPQHKPMVSVGQHETYTPLLPGFSAKIGGRIENISAVTVDSNGNQWVPDVAFNTQLRVGAFYDTVRRLSWARIRLQYEHDFFSGIVHGGDAALDAVFLPGSEGYDDHQLRKLSVMISFDRFLTIGGGFMTSHWGLGLLANDGARGWKPGNGRFSDPRGGDRVLRALIATGPHTTAALRVFVAADMLWGDDVLFDDDEGIQLVAGVQLGTGKTWELGVYGVHRLQEAADGQKTTITAIDLFGRYVHKLGGGHSMSFAAEGAIIFGKTELAPSPRYPEHDVHQLGAAVRVSYDAPVGGAILDLLYASGDQNLDDGAQNGFKADLNYDMGMLLYRQVIGAQTARSAVTAANPLLSGVPREDLDRFPTRGNATNTIALFPRGYVRPIDGLEFYAGILIALAEVAYVDPLNMRLAGGDPRNPLDGDPGMYYGTEFDLGANYQTLLWGTQVTFAAEGAVFLPGDALTGPGGLGDDPIFGGRVSLTWEL